MGSSADAYLVYGYYFGGPDDDPQFEEGGLDELHRPWYDPEDRDFDTHAMKHLLRTVAGFTETDWQVEGYFERKRAAEAELGVEFVSGGGDAYSVDYLVAFQEFADWGQPVYADFDELESRRILESWDNKLGRAVEALGLTPKRKPSWIVFSYYG